MSNKHIFEQRTYDCTFVYENKFKIKPNKVCDFQDVFHMMKT